MTTLLFDCTYIINYIIKLMDMMSFTMFNKITNMTKKTIPFAYLSMTNLISKLQGT